MIEKPVEGVQTDARPHPTGGKGARLSLKEVAERAWKARMSPRLRAWATQVLAKARGLYREAVASGAKRSSTRFRANAPYIADPVMGEFMETPDQMLCLDEGGLCFIGTDCDGCAITLAAAMMSIGIPAMIIGSSHRAPADVPTHVTWRFRTRADNGFGWTAQRRCPSVRSPPRLREFHVEPGADAKEKGEGDFVGM